MHKPAFLSRQIGDFQVTPLSDGSMAAGLALLSGINIDDAADIQRSAGVIDPAISTLVAILFAVGEGRFWSTRVREAACWKPVCERRGVRQTTWILSC